jgi:acetolactate synthase I/II/III large subunit
MMEQGALDGSKDDERELMTMVLRALADQGVEHVFGYPGGAVLPIYDEVFQQDKVKHILVRHEQGAGHAAEGYARSTGKPASCWSPRGRAPPTW